MADPELVEADPAAADDAFQAPPPSIRLVREVRARSSNLRCTLSAVGAWAITVAPLAVSGRASVLVRILALVSLAPGLAGPLLSSRGDRLARHVGVTGFLGGVLATWTLASLDQALTRVDTFRAILGAVAWGVFALSWSHPWSVSDEALSNAPEGETVGLSPRRKPPLFAVVVAGLGVAFAVACLGMAWRVGEPSRAVLAQAVAVGAAVALLTSASAVAVVAGRESRREGRRVRLPVNRRVFNNLLLTTVVAALALALRYL